MLCYVISFRLLTEYAKYADISVFLRIKSLTVKHFEFDTQFTTISLSWEDDHQLYYYFMILLWLLIPGPAMSLVLYRGVESTPVS